MLCGHYGREMALSVQNWCCKPKVIAVGDSPPTFIPRLGHLKYLKHVTLALGTATCLDSLAHCVHNNSLTINYGKTLIFGWGSMSSGGGGVEGVLKNRAPCGSPFVLLLKHNCARRYSILPNTSTRRTVVASKLQSC